MARASQRVGSSTSSGGAREVGRPAGSGGPAALERPTGLGEPAVWEERSEKRAGPEAPLTEGEGRFSVGA
jgi:hypothetical protein